MKGYKRSYEKQKWKDMITESMKDFKINLKRGAQKELFEELDENQPIEKEKAIQLIKALFERKNEDKIRSFFYWIKTRKDFKDKIKEEYRTKWKVNKAKKEGVEYDAAPRYRGNVSPEAYKEREMMWWKWDSKGVRWVWPEEIENARFISWCKNSEKFKAILRFLKMILDREWRLDYNPGRVDYLFKKSDSTQDIYDLSKWYLFLKRRNKYRINSFWIRHKYYINEWFIRRNDIKRLGKVSLPLRYALMTNMQEETYTDQEWTTHKRYRLNYEYASEIQKMDKINKSKLLSSKEARYFLYKRCPFEQWESEENKIKIPHPANLNAKTFQQLVKIFWKDKDILLPIFNLCSLFSSIDEIKRFVKATQWADNILENNETTRKSIHDAWQFMLPKNWKRTAKIWKDFVLKYPEIIEYTQFFDKLESNGITPQTQENYSISKFKEHISQFVYEDIGEYVELANICNKLHLTQEDFETYKDLCSIKKKAESVPDIHIQRWDYTFRKLEYDDPTWPLLGIITDCCQHLEGAGAACARAWWKNDTSGFYVIEYKWEIIAQSWAWRGTNWELCFDSIEGLKWYNIEDIAKLYVKAAMQMIGKLWIQKVTVGLTSYWLTWEIRDYILQAKIGNIGKNTEAAKMIEHVWYSDAGDQRLLEMGDELKRIVMKEDKKSSSEENPFNILMEWSDVFCEYCDAEVHPECSICPSCHRNIEEWVHDNDNIEENDQYENEEEIENIHI